MSNIIDHFSSEFRYAPIIGRLHAVCKQRKLDTFELPVAFSHASRTRCQIQTECIASSCATPLPTATLFPLLSPSSLASREMVDFPNHGSNPTHMGYDYQPILQLGAVTSEEKRHEKTGRNGFSTSRTAKHSPTCFIFVDHQQNGAEHNKTNKPTFLPLHLHTWKMSIFPPRVAALGT